MTRLAAPLLAAAAVVRTPAALAAQPVVQPVPPVPFQPVPFPRAAPPPPAPAPWPVFVAWLPLMAVAAAAAARQQQDHEEEEVNPVEPDGPVAYEYKILRSATGAFKTPARRKAVLDEEARAGWELYEVLDHSRLRLRRPVSWRARDGELEQDPYRTRVGAGEGRIVLLIVVAGALAAIAAVVTTLLLVKK